MAIVTTRPHPAASSYTDDTILSPGFSKSVLYHNLSVISKDVSLIYPSDCIISLFFIPAIQTPFTPSPEIVLAYFKSDNAY